MLTPTLYPDCLSFSLEWIFQPCTPYRTQTTLASTYPRLGSHTFSCSIPSIGLGGLTPSSPSTPGPGLDRLIPHPVPPILDGLPLTHDDFRTQCAPLPPQHMVGSIDCPHLGLPRKNAPYMSLELTKTILDTHEATPRSWQVKPHCARTIAWSPAEDSSLPLLRCLLHSARHCLCVRTA